MFNVLEKRLINRQITLYFMHLIKNFTFYLSIKINYKY